MSGVICNFCENEAICCIPELFVPDTTNIVAYCIECGGCKIRTCNNELNKRVTWDIVNGENIDSYARDVCNYHAEPEYTPGDDNASNIVIYEFVNLWLT